MSANFSVIPKKLNSKLEKKKKKTHLLHHHENIQSLYYIYLLIKFKNPLHSC